MNAYGFKPKGQQKRGFDKPRFFFGQWFKGTSCCFYASWPIVLIYLPTLSKHMSGATLFGKGKWGGGGGGGGGNIHQPMLLLGEPSVCNPLSCVLLPFAVSMQRQAGSFFPFLWLHDCLPLPTWTLSLPSYHCPHRPSPSLPTTAHMDPLPPFLPLPTWTLSLPSYHCPHGPSPSLPTTAHMDPLPPFLPLPKWTLSLPSYHCPHGPSPSLPTTDHLPYIFSVWCVQIILNFKANMVGFKGVL